ncbi:hypothetical protein KY345_02265 [Candidatus Woesearchaeota archaeon]|nr:hypothetical protein [Candidatus Woesearchaeota archaeon]
MSEVFNHEFNFKELGKTIERANCTTLDVCTVRSDSVGSSSLGNLYWMLVAKRFSENGCIINVYDFPNNGANPSVLPVQEIADILGIENIYFHRAEENPDNGAREILEHFAREYVPKGFPGIHRDVSVGLLKSKDGKLDSSLDRMVEELDVFLNGIDDPSRVQMMGHERETVQLIRYLTDSEKQYWRVDLGGVVSEFRAIKIPTLHEFPDRIIMGKSQDPKYHEFFEYVLDELTYALVDAAKERFPDNWHPRFFDSENKQIETKTKRSRLRDVIDRAHKLELRLIPYVFCKLNNPDLGDEVLYGFRYSSDRQGMLDSYSQLFFIAGDNWREEMKKRKVSEGILLDEAERANKLISNTRNTDYKWPLTFLGMVHTGGEERGLARNVIINAIPYLKPEELIEHGVRFAKSNNLGRGNIFFEAYIKQGHREQVKDILDVYRSTRCGNAHMILGKLLHKHNLFPDYSKQLK